MKRKSTRRFAVLLTLALALMSIVPAQATVPNDIYVNGVGFTPNKVVSYTGYCYGYYGCWDALYIQSLDNFATHNITMDRGCGFGSGACSWDIAPGTRREIVIARTLIDSYAFYCKYFPSMRGEILVAGF